jgi:hypothetical protein
MASRERQKIINLIETLKFGTRFSRDVNFSTYKYVCGWQVVNL